MYIYVYICIHIRIYWRKYVIGRAVTNRSLDVLSQIRHWTYCHRHQRDSFRKYLNVARFNNQTYVKSLMLLTSI